MTTSLGKEIGVAILRPNRDSKFPETRKIT